MPGSHTLQSHSGPASQMTGVGNWRGTGKFEAITMSSEMMKVVWCPSHDEWMKEKGWKENGKEMGAGDGG